MLERQQYLKSAPERKITQLFDRVEGTFYRVLDERRQKLGEETPKPTAERHHWDAADISFHWQGADSIDRNVHPFLERDSVPAGLPVERTGDLALSVEINAWKDEEQPDGNGIRRFRSEIPLRLKPPFRNEQLQKALNRAYAAVSSWGEEDLTGESPLTPLPQHGKF